MPHPPRKTSTYTPQFARDLKDIRVGFAPVDFNEGVDPAARADYAKALETIRSLGVQVTEAKMPDFPYAPPSAPSSPRKALPFSNRSSRAARWTNSPTSARSRGSKPDWRFPPTNILKAMRIRALIQEAFHDLLSTVDVLIAPTRYDPAPKITQPLDRRATERPIPATPGLTTLIPAGNLAGLPALSLPCGFANGMPMGLQLVGSPFSENVLLTIGKTFQDRTDWHKRRPPIAAS